MDYLSYLSCTNPSTPHSISRNCITPTPQCHSHNHHPSRCTPLTSHEPCYLRAPKRLAMNSKKSQTPKLANITLRPSQRTKWLDLKAAIAIVGPGPYLAAQLCAVPLNQVPQAVVGCEDLVMQRCIGAEVWCGWGAYVSDAPHGGFPRMARCVGGLSLPGGAESDSHLASCLDSPAPIMASCQLQTTVPW
jgi:hypothetical protein